MAGTHWIASLCPNTCFSECCWCGTGWFLFWEGLGWECKLPRKRWGSACFWGLFPKHPGGGGRNVASPSTPCPVEVSWGFYILSKSNSYSEGKRSHCQLHQHFIVWKEPRFHFHHQSHITLPQPPIFFLNPQSCAMSHNFFSRLGSLIAFFCCKHHASLNQSWSEDIWMEAIWKARWKEWRVFGLHHTPAAGPMQT